MHRLASIYKLIHALPRKRTALCVSGGGIRSAMFGLGIIQGFARHGMLNKFDYLSTVSGGGHIGGWLTAWIHRHPEGVNGVAAELSEPGTSNRHSEPYPVAWLRSYSNYLSPRLGIFSPDSWAVISTYLRNLIANWLVFLPLIAAGLMLPRMYIALVRQTNAEWVINGSFWGGCVFLFLALTYLHLYRPSVKQFRRHPFWSTFEQERYVALACVLPMLLSALLLTTSWAWFRNAAGTLEDVALWGIRSLGCFAIGGALIHMSSWLFSAVLLRREVSRWLATEVLIIAWSGALGGYFLWELVGSLPPNHPVGAFAELYACVAMPLYLALFLLVTTLATIVTGRFTLDEDRAWFSRAGAWVMMTGIAWGLLSGLVIVSSILLVWSRKLLLDNDLTTFVGGSVATIAALIGAFSSRTKATNSAQVDSPSALAELAVRYLAAPSVILFVMALVSLGTSFMLNWLSFPHSVEWSSVGLHMPEDSWGHMSVIHNAALPSIVQLWISMVLVGVCLSFYLDINKFSLHEIYRQRLIRVYLAASNRVHHRANVFTGYDPNDNLQMHDLLTDSSPDKPIQRPFHVVNIALNSVMGRNLAWLKQKVHSFTVTPLHCGNSLLGYRRSDMYGRNAAGGGAITLGTALTISGVTASPNIGYHSYAPARFLLTLFCARLGWWLGNPGIQGRATYGRSCPHSGVFPVVSEVLGVNSYEGSYVFLSDGGHFENLGFYEMVARRCHCIVVVDAGHDPDHTFEDLATAIRKIRVDLGIRAEIELNPLRLQEENRLTRAHWAIGILKYSECDRDATDGVFIYIKPSLTGDEPVDVLQYRANHKDFPQEPIFDQCLSDSQTESYRQLGEHIGLQLGMDEAVLQTCGFATARHQRP
ncbi:MAG: conserved membrane protein of unknown function [Nitrospira sp.]